MNALQTYMSKFFCEEKQRTNPEISRAILASTLYKFCETQVGDKKYVDFLAETLQGEVDLNATFWLNPLPDVHAQNAHSATTSSANKKISKVQINGFRGFKRNPQADDDKGTCFHFTDTHNRPFPKVILFAPNGGGKTSFCEALEYHLTGEIKEAKRRGEKLPSRQLAGGVR